MFTPKQKKILINHASQSLGTGLYVTPYFLKNLKIVLSKIEMRKNIFLVALQYEKLVMGLVFHIADLVYIALFSHFFNKVDKLQSSLST